jgi:two-component system sensor histidine kinase VicK
MPSSNYLQYLTDRTSILLFGYDLTESKFTFMNPACTTFFNLDSVDVSPAHLLNMVSEDDRAYLVSKFEAFISGKNIENIEFRVKRGKYERWLRITPYLINEDGNEMIVGQAEDITNSKATIDLLNNHNIKKNSILTILAHDLAGPIGTVQNLATLLNKETIGLQNPRIEHLISLINKISKSNIHLIRNFLDQEFLESFGTILFKKRVDIVTKVRLATEEILNMQEELKIEFNCTSNQPVIYAEIDEDKFLQVINNLITNSLKFTADGGKIEIYVAEHPDEVVITVRDNGIGIPKKHHATLFDKFTNARRSGLKGEISTGLGMSIIKTIVEWHNGRIWFESEENQGTSFYIHLPKQQVN